MTTFIGILLTTFWIVVLADSTKIVKIPLKPMDSPLVTMLKQTIYPEVAMAHGEINSGGIPVPLNAYMDSDVYGEIKLGQPGQTFLVGFDTSWSDSWVPSTHCTTYTTCVMRNKYNPARSHLSIKTPYTLNVTLGKSSLVGNVFYDLFQVNGVNITNQAFAAMTEIPWIFFYSKLDGIIGMSLSPNDVITPIMWNLKKQKKIDQRVFSFYLNRKKSSATSGSLVLGGVDPAHYNGNITYVSLVQSDPPQWMLRINNITIKGPQSNKTVNLCGSGCNAVMVTGSNPITVPARDLAVINQALQVKSTLGRYTVSCSNVKNLPDIMFSIGNESFVLKSEHYINKLTIAYMSWCVSAFVENFDPKDTNWYIGGAFMSKYYTTFDIDQGRIGFAEANHG